MKFRNLYNSDLFIVLKEKEANAEHRVMVKTSNEKAQFAAGVSKGTMFYEGTLVLINLDQEVVKISRVGIIPGHI